MRITWLISSAVTTHNGEWTSPLASLRYRVLAPARYLRERGNQVEFLTVDAAIDTASHSATAIDTNLRADVVIISKVFAQRGVLLAQRAKQLGARVLLDICDDHFDTPELSQAYFALCAMADRIVASTAAMAETILQRTGKRATVIDDPFEGPAAEPMFAPRVESTRLLWFGHPVNFDTVADMLPGLIELSQRRPLALQVITEARNRQIDDVLHDAGRQSNGRLTTALTPWSSEATWRAMQSCDLVLLPSLPIAKKIVKSPNRAVESIRAGRFVIAYPLPSYCELGDYLWLSESMAAGIEWAIHNPREVRQRLTDGQIYVARRFNPSAVGRAWDAVIQQCVDAPAKVG